MLTANSVSWKYPSKGELPPVGLKVIGVWKNQAMRCWRNAEGSWIDELHNCYCYTAPEAYIEDPFEDNK